MALGASNRQKRFKDLPPHQQRAGLKITAMLAFIGFAMLAALAVYEWSRAAYISDTVEAKAVVSSVETQRTKQRDDSSSTRIYLPTFELTTPDGTTHLVTPAEGDSSWDFQRGQEITVRYRPDAPQSAAPWDYQPKVLGIPIARFMLLGAGAMFFLVGTIGSAVGWINYRKAQRDTMV